MTADTNRRQIVQPEGEQSWSTRARRRATGHWQLIIVLVLFVCLASGYSLVLPLGEAADETDHFALVRFIAERGRPPLTIEERRAIGPKGDASPIYHGLVALLTQHVDVSALPALPDTQARPERFIPTDGFRANRIFHTEDEAFPFRGIVLAWHLARLASIPLGAATVVAAYITALAIYPHRRYFALAVASFVAFLPRFVIGSAVVNDDNLVVPLVAFSVYCLVRVAQGDRSRRTFIVLGALMGGAAITKYHSLLLVLELIVVLAVLAWRNHRKAGTAAGDGPSLLGRLGWSLLAFGLVAGWWFAFLMIQFNQVAELGWIGGLMAPLGDPVVTSGFGRVLDLQPGGTPSYEFGWGDWADLLFRSFWVSYAWLHLFATPTVYWILGFFCVVVLLGLLRPVWCRVFPGRKPSGPASASGWRLDVAVLALHLFVYLTVIVMRYLLRPARETGQGRHLYPALTSVAFFFTLGLANSWEMIRWSLGKRPGDRCHAEGTGRLKGEAGLALGIGGALFALSLLALPVFILPEYHPYLSIVTARPADVTIPHRLSVSFADGLELAGYRVDKPEVRAGDPVSVTLYWYADARQERDYLVEVCLRDDRDQMVTCRRGHPIDGRYPMRAWEVGYLIRDQVDVPTPDCVAAGDYELVLSLLPLRLDTANTAVDWQSAQRLVAEGHNPVSLGKVTLLAAPGAVAGGTRSPGDGFSLWAGDELHDGEGIGLDQMRQQLTVITYQPARSDSAEEASDTGGGEASPVRLVPAGGHTQAIPDWLPVAHFTEETSRLSYDCPAGYRATTYNFVLDPAVRPGRYHLAIGDEVQDDWPIDVATRFRDFSPPSDIPYRLDASFIAQAGESPPRLQLLGYDMDRSPRWPGDVVPITAYWQSHQTMSQHYVVSFYLLDPLMQPWGQVDWTLGGHYPSVLWAPGESVDEAYPLPVGNRTPPGLYTIEMSLYEYVAPPRGETGDGASTSPLRFLLVTTPVSPEPVEHLYLERVRVMDPAETTSPSHPTAFELGDQIRLLGYDVPADELGQGDTLDLVLHWQATSPPARDYTVFTQLIGPDGLVWGQKDNQPQAGRFPTTSWDLTTKVVDRYHIPLQDGAPVGQYRLLVGMYELTTGERLPVVDESGNRLPDDAIPLANITVGR
jgi:hypothetical protein